jgi:hypothetical protein
MPEQARKTERRAKNEKRNAMRIRKKGIPGRGKSLVAVAKCHPGKWRTGPCGQSNRSGGRSKKSKRIRVQMARRRNERHSKDGKQTMARKGGDFWSSGMFFLLSFFEGWEE